MSDSKTQPERVVAKAIMSKADLEDYFLRECERRAGASREEMLGFLDLVVSIRRPMGDLAPEPGKLELWLRSILGGGK